MTGNYYRSFMPYGKNSYARRICPRKDLHSYANSLEYLGLKRGNTASDPKNTELTYFID